MSITAPLLARVVDKVVDRGAAAHAGKVLATLKQLFKFAQARGYIDISPATPLSPVDLGVVSNPPRLTGACVPVDVTDLVLNRPQLKRR